MALATTLVLLGAVPPAAQAGAKLTGAPRTHVAATGECTVIPARVHIIAAKFCTRGTAQLPGVWRGPGAPPRLSAAGTRAPGTAAGLPTDGTWSRVMPPGPGHRFGAMTAYDAALKRTVLFGGYLLGQPLPTDTWLYDGHRWSVVHTKHTPPARYLAAFAYSPAARKVVMFGGFNPWSGADGVVTTTCGMFADTWTFDGTDWTAVSTGEDPQTCTATPMSSQGTPGPQPASRYGPAMAYDPASRSLIMFGGYGCWQMRSCGYLNDTWKFTYTWLPLTTKPTPPARFSAVMASSAGSAPVLFSGENDGVNPMLTDTWTWQATHWVQQSSRTSPGQRIGAGGSEWPGHGPVIAGGDPNCFQACTFYADMWLWRGGQWVKLAAQLPEGRGIYLPGLSADPAGRLLLSNGLTDVAPTSRVSFQARDSYVFDGRGWRKNPYAWPESAEPLGFWWDPHRKADVLVESPHTFEGASTSIETWQLRGGTWRMLPGTGVPGPPRQLTGMGYDPELDQGVLFGGQDLAVGSDSSIPALGWYDDTWVFHAGHWKRVFPAHTPPPGNAQISYNPDLRSLVMQLNPQPTLGDLDDPAPWNSYQMWRWTGNDWVHLDKLLGPTEGRLMPAFGYVPARHSTILYGGERGGGLSPRADLDTLELAATSPAWLPVPGLGPDPSYAGAAIEQTVGGDVVMFGGCDTNLVSSTAGANVWAFSGDATSGSATVNGLCNTDTWSIDANGWHKLLPAASPEPLTNARMAPLADGRPAMFGGTYELFPQDDLWVWNRS